MIAAGGAVESLIEIHQESESLGPSGVGYMSLSQEEIDGCHEAFREVDVERRGNINVWELRIVLQGSECGI